MKIYAKDVIKIAEQELGYHEKASNSKLDDKTANSGSKNYTKYARDLHNAGYYNGNKNGYEWCDVFVDWCFYKAFGAKEGQRIQCQTGALGAGTKYSMQYYEAQKRFDGTPRVGDQVFFRYSGSTGADHTGIVVEVTDKLITTVEGNSNDRVQKKTYSRGYSAIIGYGHPKYDDADTIAVMKEDKTVNIKLSMLNNGSIGNEVKTLQRLLKQLGYKDKNGNVLAIDGEFGANTEYAVRRYQSAKRLENDGIVGENTWTKLLRG